jgi:hypothetical protein
MIISIIILIFLFLFFIKYLNKKRPIIQYLNKDELANILKKDNDNYYKKMSKLNLELRDIQDLNSYLLSIDKLLYTISNSEQVIINNAIKKANIHLQNASKILKKRKFVGFDYNKIKDYPWFIGCSNGQQFEFGYPHTRMDIIILNYENIYDPDLYKTLMHERIHIYQRLNPNNMKLFLQAKVRPGSHIDPKNFTKRIEATMREKILEEIPDFNISEFSVSSAKILPAQGKS